MRSPRRPRIAVTVAAVPPPRRPAGAVDRWLASSIPPRATVLNIGSGHTGSRQMPRTRHRAALLVGVDPSERSRPDATIDEHHQTTLQQFAPRHPEAFDAAYAIFVLEHVTDPHSFTQACAATLKPGGMMFAVTVNKWHYFGLSAWTATRLGVSDWLLPKVRHDASTEHYHFPTSYRMNSIRAVSQLLAEAGFTAAEFRMWDLPSLYTPYLPSRVEPLPRAWSACAYRLNWPHAMGHLTFRATR